MNRAIHIEERVILSFELRDSDVFCWNLIEAERCRQEQLYIGLRKAIVEVGKKYFGEGWRSQYCCSAVVEQAVAKERFFHLRVEIVEGHRVVYSGKCFYNAGRVRLELLKNERDIALLNKV